MTPEIWHDIEREMKADRKKSPKPYDHIVSRGAMVTSAANKLQESCINLKYRSKTELMREVEK